MAYSKILLEPMDEILLLKLNDPASLNPMSYEMGMEFQEAMETIRRDSTFRGLVITGSGPSIHHLYHRGHQGRDCRPLGKKAAPV